MRRICRRLPGMALAATLLLSSLVEAQTEPLNGENGDLVPLPQNIIKLLESRRGDEPTMAVGYRQLAQ